MNELVLSQRDLEEWLNTEEELERYCSVLKSELGPEWSVDYSPYQILDTINGIILYDADERKVEELRDAQARVANSFWK